MKEIKKIQRLLITSILSLILLGACSSQTTTPATSNVDSTIDTDGDGMPDSVESTYGTNIHTVDTDGDGINDKEDSNPVYTDNLIIESSTTALPVKVDDVRVEDNTGADHLEMTLTNTSNQDLSNFDIYYTITDKVDSTQEAYYQVLTGLSIGANQTVTLHFDNDVLKSNHFYQNMNGLYGTSANGLTFDINLHSKNYQSLNFSVDKADGTAEVAD